VIPEGSSAPESKNEPSPKRSPVDEAGIQRVLEYEKAQGREPEEMDQYNPGYDIRSTDLATGDDRFIEVKSMFGAWDSLGAGISSRQFEMAFGLEEGAWLYVVEKAEDDSRFQIHTIQNPAKLVDQFMYLGPCEKRPSPTVGSGIAQPSHKPCRHGSMLKASAVHSLEACDPLP
jgi:hypothetical protein